MKNTKHYIRLHLMYLLIAGSISILSSYILFNIKYLKHILASFRSELKSIWTCLKVSENKRENLKFLFNLFLLSSHYYKTNKSSKNINNLNNTFNFQPKIRQQITSLSVFKQKNNLFIPFHYGSFPGYVFIINIP